HMHHAAREFVIDPSRTLWNHALGGILHRPQQFHSSPLHRPHRQVVSAQTFDRGRSTLGLPADRSRERERDRGQSGGEPEDGEESAAAGRGSSKIEARSSNVGCIYAFELRTSIFDLRSPSPHTSTPPTGAYKSAPSPRWAAAARGWDRWAPSRP